MQSDISTDKLLNEIEESVDSVKIIVKETQAKRKKKSEIPLHFDILENEDNISLKLNLIKYINTKDYTYQDLFDFCIKRCNGDEKAGKTLAYNTITGLSEKRNIRADTIDLICEFLNVDIIIQEKEF